MTESLLRVPRTRLAEAAWRLREARLTVAESPEFRTAFAAAAEADGWLARREAELLFSVAREIEQASTIVEIGSFHGRSTIVLAAAARLADARVVAVDPHTGDRSAVDAGTATSSLAAFLENLERAQASDVVEPIVRPSVDAAADWSHGPEVDFLFVDGWHSEEAVYADGVGWQPHLCPDAFVAFDDFRDPEVAAGIARLLDEGVVQRPLGSVGKILLCGPESRARRSRRLRTLLRPPVWKRGR